jgi:hypothetical protein
VRPWKKSARREYRQQRDELRELLWRWNPIGPDEDDDPHLPADEYDCLIPPLLKRLDAGENADALASFLSAELESHFGLEPVPERERSFARQVVAWYASRG